MVQGAGSDNFTEGLNVLNGLLQKVYDEGIEAQKEVERLRPQLDMLKAEKERLEKEVSDKNIEIDRLTKELNETDKYKRSYKSKYNEFKGKYDALQDDYEQLVAFVNNKLPGYFHQGANSEWQKKANATRAKKNSEKRAIVLSVMNTMLCKGIGCKKTEKGIRLDLHMIIAESGAEQTFIYDTLEQSKGNIGGTYVCGFFNTQAASLIPKMYQA